MGAGSLSNLWKLRGAFVPGDTYFDYERNVGRDVVLPYLASRLELDGRRVADFGCHQGGVVEELRRDGRVASATGYELSDRLLEVTPFVADARFRLVAADVLDVAADEAFDLVLALEVLEHVPDTVAFMTVVRRSLAPGGRAVVTFPPYWSAFGGHQHYASTWVRLAPFVHYLPARLVLGLARIPDSTYMSRSDAIADWRQVRRTRLTIARAEAAFATAGLRICDRTLYLVRPEHELRYGVAARELPAPLDRPGVREVLASGVRYLLAAD
jgi:SAM-dependent methyltransferase